jgi:hypothetical protein
MVKYLPDTQEKPLCNDVCELDEQVKLSIQIFQQYITIYIRNNMVL